ncbi:22755_t:CDS:10 [Rhizophagus irregularis]|nr:22755_t:CDS:10 [Rhizophagus irregularis]
MIISPITRNIEHNTNTKTETRIFNYTASIDPIDFYEKEKASVINDDFIDVKPLPQSNIPIDSTEPVYKMQRSSIDFSNIDETIDLDSKEFSAVPTVPEGHLEEKAKSTTENVSQTTQYTAETVSSTLVNLKSKITPETTKKIVENQKPDGSIKLDKTVSDQINISSDNIQSSVQTYGVGDKISPKEPKKCLIDELKDEKLVEKLLTTSKTSSTDTSPELKEKVAKAEKYLKTELGKKAEQTIVQEIQKTVTKEEITKVIEIQNKEGSYEKISDKITEKLGEITTENISSSVHITDEHVKKFDTKVWNTFITIAYCNKVLRKQQSKVTTPNEKALTWLHTQIKDEKLVKEVLESCEKLVVEKASNKKKESSWPSLSTSLTGWGSSWGVSDLIQYTTDAVSSTLINLTTPETTKKIVENQKPDGSIKLDKTVSDQINISSDKIQSSIQTYGVSDKLKSVPKNVWETALSLRYLTITSQSQDQHKDQSEKAKKYLIEELKDEKLVEELLITSEKIIVDQKLKEKVAKAEKYLKTELGSEEKIKELLEKTDTVVVDHAAKKVIKEKADQSVIQEIQETVTEEEITKVIEIQNKEVTEKLGVITTENISSSVRITDERVKKFDTKSRKFPIRKKKKKESSPWFNLLPNWGSSDTTKQTTIKKIESIPVAPTTSTTKSPEKPKESVVSKLAEKFSDTSNTGSLIKTSSTTKEVIQYVVSKQNDDGSIEAGETVCKQLDAPPKETIVTIVQQYITNEKLKNTKPIWITTAVNIAYLKNLADQHEGEWKEKYARQYLTKEIGNPKEVDELIDASSKYVVKQSTQEVIKDKKKAANNDGSFGISKTITKELNDTSPEDLVKKAIKLNLKIPILSLKQHSCSDIYVQPRQIRIILQVPREYLSSQIRDKQLEEDIIKASSKVVIDKSSEKVAEASKKEALKEIQITPEITKTIVSTQKTDGSFEVSKEITDKLNSTSPESLVTSVITYTKNDKLKNIQPSVWQTVISMQYLKNTASQYENDWKDKYNKAEEHVRSQLGGDDNLNSSSIFDEDTKNTTISVLKGEYIVDDVRSICSSQKNDGSITLHKSIKNQFNVSSTNRLITNVKSYISNQHLRSYDDSVFETALTIYILRYVLVEHKGETQAAYERANSWLSKQLNNNKELEKELFSACEQYVIEEGSRKIEHTLQTVLKYLQERSILDDAHAIRISQNNDGSFTLHSSILEQFKILSIDEFIKGITRYVVSKQLKGELEELDSACDQYLIEKAVEAYNNQTINVQITKLDVDETTKTTIYNIYNGLRSDAKVDHALSLCKSQHNNGSFTLHKIISEQLKISSSEEAVETLKSYVGSLRLRRLDKSLWISAFIVTYFKIVLFEYESEWRKACDRATCEQYLIQQSCEFLNSKNTTIVTEVLHKPSQSVIYGSDDRAVTQKEYYLNSELIVTGAAARAKYVSKATDLALKYTEDEINRLFDNNVTHGNKDNVLNRAKRATKFLMDEYYKSDNNYSNDTFNEEDLKEAYRSRSLDIS